MGAKKVLLVDGDRDSRTVYRIMLQHHGYEVHEAEDGEQALEAVRSGAFSVVVTELTLRNIDGHALLNQLKSDPSTAGLCVVVLTARALPQDRQLAEAAGCAAFLTKPFEPQTLLSRIEALTR